MIERKLVSPSNLAAKEMSKILGFVKILTKEKKLTTEAQRTQRFTERK